MIIPVIMPPHIAGMKSQNDVFFICEISRFRISCCAINLTNSLSYSSISNWFIRKDTIIQLIKEQMKPNIYIRRKLNANFKTK